MTAKNFYLLGEDVSQALPIEIDAKQDLESLKNLVASHFAIVEPSGMFCSRFVYRTRLANTNNC